MEKFPCSLLLPLSSFPVLTHSSRCNWWGQLGSSVDWEPSRETGGPRFKSGHRHFPAVWPWTSHLIPIAYPYPSSALEPIHSIDSKSEGKGLKKIKVGTSLKGNRLGFVSSFCWGGPLFLVALVGQLETVGELVWVKQEIVSFCCIIVLAIRERYYLQL